MGDGITIAVGAGVGVEVNAIVGVGLTSGSGDGISDMAGAHAVSRMEMRMIPTRCVAFMVRLYRMNFLLFIG